MMDDGRQYARIFQAFLHWRAPLAQLKTCCQMRAVHPHSDNNDDGLRDAPRPVAQTAYRLDRLPKSLEFQTSR